MGVSSVLPSFPCPQDVQDRWSAMGSHWTQERLAGQGGDLPMLPLCKGQSLTRSPCLAPHPPPLLHTPRADRGLVP